MSVFFQSELKVAYFLTKLGILIGLLSLSSCFVINSMIANYFMCPQMETVKHIYTFLSQILFGFLSVHIHPSSTAQQQRKENTQSRYLNEMDRYGAASLNTLISAPCRPRWSKANTMHILCLRMSFSFCVRALCRLAEKVLEFLLFRSFHLCQGRSLCGTSIRPSAFLSVCQQNKFKKMIICTFSLFILVQIPIPTEETSYIGIIFVSFPLTVLIVQ